MNVFLGKHKNTLKKLGYKLLDDNFLNANGRIKEELKFKINNPTQKIQNSKFIGKPEDTFETMLFLPPGEGRQGEGGLRTKGYFKHSYNLVDGKWFIVDSDNNPVILAPEDIQSKIKQYLLSNAQYQTPITELPLITVITVVYNGAKYLEETILSVINQTYPNVEYIIIDGGSTDGTPDIIKKYEDYIDYWVSEKDKGIYDAMNKGIDLIQGQAHLYLNSGDYFVGDVINIAPKSYPVFYKVKYYNIFGKLQTIRFKNYKLQLPNCHQGILFESKNIKFNTKYKISADLQYYYDHGYKNKYFYKVTPGYIYFDNNGINKKNIKMREVEIAKIILKYNGIFWCIIFIIKAIIKVIITYIIKKIITSGFLKKE